MTLGVFSRGAQTRHGEEVYFVDSGGRGGRGLIGCWSSTHHTSSDATSGALLAVIEVD